MNKNFIHTILQIIGSSLLVLQVGIIASYGMSADTLRRVPGSKNFSGPYRPTKTLKNDILHTNLDISFDWSKQQAIGSAVVSFKPYHYPQSSLVLDAKAFQIKGVYLVGKTKEGTRPSAVANGEKLKYDYDQRRITIQLNKTYTRKDTVYVKIDYVANPNELARDHEDDHATDKGLYFINADGMDEGKPRQIWTQGETEMNSAWFPTQDTPNEKITHDFFITVDAKYKTLSNGLLLSSQENDNDSRTDHWKQSIPHAPYLAMLAVGDFAVGKEMMANGLELSYYVEPKYENDMYAIFGRTAEMIAFFSNIYGIQYPWEKYAQIAVRDFTAGAMENTTATVHEEGVQVDTRSLVDGNSDAVIAHELAHHWFGNLVTSEEWGQLPLNEAFANYAEYLWAEYDKGEEEADWANLQEMRNYLSESESKKVPLIRYFYKHREDMFDSHSYAKGGRVLHMLRKYVGDDAFFESLELYLKRNKFQTAEISDLRTAFETVTGEDLNWFFDQWFMKPGHPVIKVTQDYNAGKGVLTLDIRQTQDTVATAVYRLPLTIAIWEGGKVKNIPVVLDQARHVLELPYSNQPDLVIFDTEAQLLGTIEHDKKVKELIYQYEKATKFLHKYDALIGLEGKLADPAVRAVMTKALNDSFWRLRQLAVANFTEYTGPDFSAIEKIIRELARKDKNSMVRAEALLVLASFGDNENDQLFKEALDDESYYVVSIALDSYLLNKQDDAEEIIATFENSPNDAVLTSVGNYFAKNPSPERYEWFLEKMSGMGAMDKYNFLQVFGKYLLKCPQDIQRQSIPVLEELARHNPAHFVRFGAYQVLGLLSDIQGVNAIRKDIRAKETDKRLKDMYSQFGEL